MTSWLKVMIAAAALAIGQTQTPVFRGTTSLVVVDVQVTNRKGDVIGDLGIADFSLEVDGRPRAIASVVRQQLDLSRPAAVTRPNDNPMGTLSMSMGSGPKVEAQSFVLIVADPAMMRTDASRLLFDQAADFVDDLAQAHALALMILPSRRSQYPFGTPRATIAAALRNQLGTMRDSTAPSRPATFLPVPKREQETSERYQFNIDAATNELAAVDGRRTIIFLSDNFGGALGPAQRAADANVTIHTITTVAPAMIDVSRRTNTPTNNASPGDLPTLSDMTGGLYLQRGSNGSIVMPRIAAILAEQYLLTFNVEDGDRSGRPHTIAVKVHRNGADVRARKSFVR